MNENIRNEELEQVTGGAEEGTWKYAININDHARMDSRGEMSYVATETVRTNDPGKFFRVYVCKRGEISVRKLDDGIISMSVSSFLNHYYNYGGFLSAM